MTKLNKFTDTNSTENKQAAGQISAETFKKIINQGATVKGTGTIETGETARPNYQGAAFHTAPQYLIKKPLEAHTGKKRPDGTRNRIGKIYLSAKWIGKRVILSTTWNEGETVPEPRKAQQKNIRSEWNPGQTITAIYRTVGPHNNGQDITVGYLFVPHEWIGRDVLIREHVGTDEPTESETSGSNSAEITAPKEAE